MCTPELASPKPVRDYILFAVKERMAAGSLFPVFASQLIREAREGRRRALKQPG
jgi:hypothetical protein